MNFAPMLHDAAGPWDELLICGGGLAVMLIVFFITAAQHPKERSPDVSPSQSPDEQKPV